MNQGTLTFHPWLSRLPHLDRPDFVLFDLDPGVSHFANVVAVAKQLHEILENGKVEAFIKTSGKSGLHVLVPWSRDGDFDAARSWAAEIAHRLVESQPDLATVETRKANRSGRVYVDVMQNARGHHVVPPYVLRPVPGAAVSTPLNWREVKDDLDPSKFNLKTVPARIARQQRDPFTKFVRQIAKG